MDARPTFAPVIVNKPDGHPLEVRIVQDFADNQPTAAGR
jgi:hypothetical protein